ncbi:MAG: hypothetical protein Q8932_14715 [Bacteroidota bacterium]|nr:hypothetical protein [Bacteroidota bacterium]MDP4260731.1 hypothetical protein [Bacteroidota bacterium]
MPGLVMYMTNLRKKEIGVRKVLGASVSGIIGILSRDCKIEQKLQSFLTIRQILKLLNLSIITNVDQMNR